ncbi:lysylphosphatidylglycerol synthase transmembrane domain-containing protein [Haladaptatus sp. YSMS36]|uniref:lysylphosphatidylglycerol synthase transmembrane domain-containing protein n=1 Tax=Haladaptatus sp. YSMS36 TaxID=3033384 RepID=UPI0023E8C876|nr:lysylphosphatidylglycerol synthase transmembrane domain-containing protein [Haladaptatus sp. YSMS36]
MPSPPDTQAAGGDPTAQPPSTLALDRKTILKIGIGFLVAVAALYLVGKASGLRAVEESLIYGDHQWLVVACLSTFLGLVAWSKVWQIVLSIVGIEASLPRVTSTFFAGTFANYITPLGQVGGEPLIAYVISTEMDTNYENSLTSVVTADLLNLVPFFVFSVVGMGVLLVRAELPPVVQTSAYGLVALVVAVPVTSYIGWNHRTGVKRAVAAVVRPIARFTDRMQVDSLLARVDRFYETLDVIATAPRRLAYALVFSFVGWVFFVLPLYFSGLVLGVSLDLWLVLFIVPASTLAGFVPTPGGLGGVEVALVALLVGIVALPASQAFALAVLYRVASYWFTLAVAIVPTFYAIARA